VASQRAAVARQHGGEPVPSDGRAWSAAVAAASVLVAVRRRRRGVAAGRRRGAARGAREWWGSAVVLVGPDRLQVLLEALLAVLTDVGVGEVGQELRADGVGFPFGIHQRCGQVAEVGAVGALLGGVALEHGRQPHRLRPVRAVVGIVLLALLPRPHLCGGGGGHLRPVGPVAQQLPVVGGQDVVEDRGVAALTSVRGR